MYTPEMIIHWLGAAVVRKHTGRFCLHKDGGIKLLEHGSELLRPECLYIGTSDTAAAAVEMGRIPPEGVCIVASKEGRAAENGELSVQAPPEEKSRRLQEFLEDGLPQLTLIETDLPLLSLYNLLHEHIHRFHEWEDRLHEIVYTNGGVQNLLECAYEELQATILLVNAGYKQIAAVYDPQVSDATADELRENGYQSFDTIQRLHHEKSVMQQPNREYVEYISSISGNYTMVRLIRYREDLVARLCVIVDGAERNGYFADLQEVLAKYVAEYLFSDQGADYGGNAAFGLLAADLIECRLTDPKELEQRLKQIKLATRRYYHVMLIAFSSGEDRTMIPWNYVISQLEHIFPFSNITTYKGQILLIIRKMKRGSRLTFDRTSLYKILESYNGYACIGNASEFLTSLPPVYYQTRDALRIGPVMKPEERIFYYEDYSMYQMIELAGESARQKLGSQNLVHLCNNEVIALVLYDKKNGTNLVEVLQAYLLHERNTTETAKALFIHRNTMLYKIHKIEEIMGCGLEDPMLRERLLFSCRVLEYMTKYRKEDILVLKRSLTDPQGT